MSSDVAPDSPAPDSSATVPQADAVASDSLAPTPDRAVPASQTDTPAAVPDASAPDSGPDGGGTAAVLWDPAPRRRRRRWPWVVAAVVVLLAAAGAGGIALFLQHQERLRADRALDGGQIAAVTAAFDADAALDAQIASQRSAYRGALADWQEVEAAVAAWRATDEVPQPSAPNPGGSALPGSDPTGQGFLDAMGATDVQVLFDGGPANCGYAASGDLGWGYYAVGGCYNPTYRNWVSVAWDRGGESIVWSIFVHEAMHWYQHEHYSDILLAADVAGVTYEQYAHDMESDASCRAVSVYGIPASDYADSSAPCDVDGWYEGWLRDRIVALGVPAAEPAVADYEVVGEVRP